LKRQRTKNGREVLARRRRKGRHLFRTRSLNGIHTFLLRLFFLSQHHPLK
jgi:hypothetical protein